MNKKRQWKKQVKTSQEQLPRFFGKQYFLLTIFWTVFTALLILLLLAFIKERTMINSQPEIQTLLDELSDISKTETEKQNIAKQLLNKVDYPVINFSLLSFNFLGKQVITDHLLAWNDYLKNINLAYSYVFISVFIALISWCFHILINIKIINQARFARKYNLSTFFSNDYPIFYTKIYLNFSSNLAIIFTFFNFGTTLVTLAYGIFLLLASILNRYLFKIKNNAFLDKKWWTNPNFAFFASVLVIQNSYTLAKSYFMNKFGVDLDIIINILMPIGSITIIITIFIRNMLNSSVTSVKNAVKNIQSRVNTFKIFIYAAQEKDIFDDYNFVNEMPKIVKDQFLNKIINKQQGLDLLTTIDDTVDFFKKYIHKTKELNYMMYHLFYDVTQIEEIEEMRYNILKVAYQKNNKK